jgi:hypothetical protein
LPQIELNCCAGFRRAPLYSTTKFRCGFFKCSRLQALSFTHAQKGISGTEMQTPAWYKTEFPIDSWRPLFTASSDIDRATWVPLARSAVLSSH